MSSIFLLPIFIAISYYDIKYYIVPYTLIFFLIVLSFFSNFNILSSALLSYPLSILYGITDKIGYGDVMLVMALGLFFENISAYQISLFYLIASSIAILIYIVLNKRKIPFSPCLLIAFRIIYETN